MLTDKLIIFGRDGVLNRYRPDHVKTAAEWEPLPGALDALARLTQSGWHAVVATNQEGIGRGVVDMTSVNAIHHRIIKAAQAAGGRIDAFFLCPHAPEESCDCRKPQPGLILQIAKRYNANLARVPLVCDNVRDLQTAHAAGCQPHLIGTGRAAALPPEEIKVWVDSVPGTRMHRDLSAFADFWLHDKA
jgi:D-glycero-D-manno-heptose 1,7-bisphosphate phosphatase